MSSFVGFLSLIVSLGLAIIIITTEISKKISTKKFFLLLRISNLLTFVSFFSLMYAYITSDFSNFNVFQNSHSNKPLIYKIAGTWANHEGSMLLWISVMALYSFVFSLQKNLDVSFQRMSLFIQTILFIFFTT